MRVGILTFHDTNNYGAELQAYALCETVEGLGCEAELVDYRNPAVARAETPARPTLGQLAAHPRSSLIRLAAYPYLARRRAAFAGFRARCQKTGPRMEGQCEMAARYDAVVVGSDQVWNPAITGGDLTYFLPDPAPFRKVAYAASFGGQALPEGFAPLCRAALAGFDAVGVREASGCEVVRAVAGRRAERVLDPTLLLGLGRWRELAGPPPVDGGYVLAYLVAECEQALSYARRAARAMGARLVVVECYSVVPALRIEGNMSDISPEGFVSLVAHASLVVTSSFHGLALSLALGVEVRFSLDASRGNRSSRLTELAELAGVGDCAVPEADASRRIDFAAVARRLSRARERSLAFLAGSQAKGDA